ncbi:hypothetical protein Acsp01_91250 [Actinoplanes sp. NBRC 101535]|nr:hypothetical protein Acsp01_91250 [Actinoplanes sp. NBRC 101535]
MSARQVDCRLDASGMVGAQGRKRVIDLAAALEMPVGDLMAIAGMAEDREYPRRT